MSFKAIWVNNTPYSKFMISVGIILISAVTFTLISTSLVSIIWGISFEELQGLFNDLTNPQALEALKLVQIVSAIGTFILPPFIIAYLIDNNPLAFLSLKRKMSILPIIYVSIAFLVSVPAINYLSEINSSMHLPGFLRSIETWMRESEDRATVVTKAFLEMPTFSDLMMNMFMIALIPAIGEELLFRGLVQRIFTSWFKNIHTGIWLSAFLFSALHMQFYGFLPRMLLGGMLGYLLVWSGSLWLPILAHFINNGSAVLFTYLYQHQFTDFDADKIGAGQDMFVPVLFSTLMTISLLFLTYHFYQKRRLLAPV